MASYSNEAFEEIGRTVRVALEIDDQIKPDPIDFLRRLKRAGYIRDFVRLPDAAMLDAEAKYNPDEKTIYLRNSVCDGAECGNPHFRFTVFHEGAHAVLGHQRERKRSFTARAQMEKKVPSIGRDEGDANKLTVAIMAPFHKAAFTLEMTSEEIASRFGLSPKAASTRYDEFAQLYRRAHNLRRQIPKSIVDFLTEQRRRGYVVTSLPQDEVSAFKPVQSCYTGDACPNPNCRQFKMIRVGTYTKCDACGAKTGEE